MRGKVAHRKGRSIGEQRKRKRYRILRARSQEEEEEAAAAATNMIGAGELLLVVG